jgi:hypothetical protein
MGELALRMLGGVDFRRSFEFLSYLEFLSFSLLFPWFCRFSCFLLALRFFLLLDDLLELFLAFGSSNCTSLGLGFKIQNLCFCVVNGLIKGEIEKPSRQFLYLIVMIL